MSLNNTLSQFRKAKFSYFRTFSFISLVTLILFISTANVYSAQVKLTWNTNTESDLAGYKIYYGNSSGNYDNIVDVGNETSYTLSGLLEGATYYIVLTAHDFNGNESGYSGELIYTVPLSDTTTPSTPTNLQATATSTSQINLSWDASTDDVGVTGYRIYRDATQIATTTGITYQDTGLSPSTTYTYTISAIDGAGNESNQSSSVSATTLSLSVNNPPVLDPISDIFTSEGATITLNPTANDPDGDALTYTYSGWMTSASYTTGYNDAGTHTVTVTVSDGSLTDSQDVMITVLNGGNSAPVLDPISDIFVTEGATITLNPTATDPDGDALTYTYSGWMTSASYTTDYNDAGVHTVTVTVSDGTLTDSQDVTITVNDDPNQAASGIPVTWVDTVGVTVNANSITKNASNGWGNGGAASLESFTGDGGVEFTATQTNTYQMCGLSSANLDASYTSIEYAIYPLKNGRIYVFENGFSLGEFGSYQIGDKFMVERVGSTIVYKKNGVIFYTSLTPAGSALMVDCSIYNKGAEISDVNLIGAWVGGGPSDSTSPSTPANLQATAISTSQIDLTWDASTDDVGVTGYRIYRDWVQIATTTGTTYQDTGLSASTTYMYTVSAIDAAGNESNQSSSVSVTTLSLPVNNPPVLDQISDISVNEGDTVTLNPTATDPDGDALTYTYSGWMTSASYTTGYNDAGTHTVTVTVSDGSLTDSQDVMITVLNGNSVPVLDPISDIFVTEGATVTLNPTANDPDGDALTYTYSGWMTSASYTTGYNDAGTHTVTVTVSDGSLTDSQDVMITVLNDNSAPVLDPIADITANEGDTVTLNPTANDPDGDALTYTYSGWMASASYTTGYNDAGVHTVTVTVSDGTLTDSQDVTITVNDDPNQVTSVVPVTWVDTVGVTVNANSITKNASNGWGNGGAASLESFTGDGGVEFTATQTNTYRMCGLSSANPDADYKSIEYAIYPLTRGRIYVFENGINKGNFGSYQIGDKFMVERVDSSVVYKKNGVIFYTSLTPAGSVLFVDCAIYNDGGEISNANLIGIMDIGGGPL